MRVGKKPQNPTAKPQTPAAPAPDFVAYLLGGVKVDTFEIDRNHDTGREAEHLD